MAKDTRRDLEVELASALVWPNFGVKLSACWCSARRPSWLPHSQSHGAPAELLVSRGGRRAASVLASEAGRSLHRDPLAPKARRREPKLIARGRRRVGSRNFVTRTDQVTRKRDPLARRQPRLFVRNDQAELTEAFRIPVSWRCHRHFLEEPPVRLSRLRVRLPVEMCRRVLERFVRQQVRSLKTW